ncbi:metallophosphoesterase family protein [Silvibacterium dinghuense]|uniref:Phosphoesterase n=1 Tax=Silvibacterium dinghuense TaxID=1560006 RepID=A0A4Q1SBM3_9BACT|nr:metallophosphoesterase family protein [Silvibacterium dinghuense]RXS94425.1 metallophosphoesterase [Silvibacterium dinghuense]GGH16202.1 phosphoesterase [Silvibacterium dinghuense]
MRIGVISDTHGLLRPEAVAALQGVDAILHAGDVGDPAILDALAAIAPVTTIRGNIDRKGSCAELPAIELVEMGGTSIYMLHDRQELDLDPVAAGIAAVISGHSHQPLIEWKKDVLYFNPGSAGPRRFSLPISLGILEIKDGRLEPRLITLG